MASSASNLAELGRVPFSLRIGVSGHLWITSEDENIQATLSRVLSDVMAAANSSTDATPVRCTIVSSLAEGADRAVAHAALARDARLEVVLPMSRDEFVKDFTAAGSREEFDRLIARAASVTVVPGDGPRPERYLDAGKAIADRSDVLLALWDGRPAGGVGGTADVVRYADDVGLPTLVVRAEVGPPVRLLPPTAAPEPLGPLLTSAFSRLDAYNSKPLTGREQRIAGPRLADGTGVDWLPHYLRADLLALRYQRLYHRLSAVTYGLAATAVAIAGLVVFDPPGQTALAEVVVLATLMALVLWARRQDFLGRWTAARFVAERLRSAMFLAEVGAVPTFASEPGGMSDDTSRYNWTARAVRELWYRLSPGPHDVDQDAAAVRLREEWIKPQIKYHERAYKTAARRRLVTGRLIFWLFTLSLIAALTHGLESHWLGRNVLHGAEYVSIVVPAVAAAIAGYVAQQEYPRQMLRSRRALKQLMSVRDALAQAHPSETVQVTAAQIDRLVHADSVEWFVTANLHEPELPT